MNTEVTRADRIIRAGGTMILLMIMMGLQGGDLTVQETQEDLMMNIQQRTFPAPNKL